MQALEQEARDARKAAKRASNPEQLKTPGKGNNRALRRLAKKNGVTLTVLQLLQLTGKVTGSEKRIDKKKIAAFVAALKRSAKKKEVAA